MDLRGLIVLGLATLFTVSCSVRDDVGSGEEERPVPADFSFSLQQMNPLPSKADLSAFPELNPSAGLETFRGLDNIRILPFATGSKNPVVADSRTVGAPIGLPSIPGEQDSQVFFFPQGTVALPSSTSSVLVYGQAPRLEAATAVEEKQLNGSLVEEGWDGVNNRRARAVIFSPESIYNADSEQVCQEMAGLLNAVAVNAVYELNDKYWIESDWGFSKASVSWNGETGDEDLKTWFKEFTGEGNLVPGSAAHMELRLTTLFKHLVSYASQDGTRYTHEASGAPRDAQFTDSGEFITYAYLYNQLRDLLLERIRTNFSVDEENEIVRFKESRQQEFPASIALPAGAMVLRWDNAGGFAIIPEGLDGFIPVSRYCYMPPLYYYANTHLSVSFDRYVHDHYATSSSWDQVLSHYQDGKVVTGKIKSVALDSPLQYACALLVATVKASSSVLPDNDGDDNTNCSVTGNHFPVTGIILGSQFKQDFDFSPVVDDESMDAEEYYLYDGLVEGVNLTAAESAELRTLVLPTPVARDAYFFLELENNSGSAFQGHDGVIPAGCRFYLTGKMEGPAENAALNRVFMQDCYTRIQCTVSTLANAYLTIPQAGDPELLLGVQTVPNWYFSRGSYIQMD